ncbi:SulA-like leucine-rich domain-containing protein [Catenovulum sediminis]|uniref:SulA-like leucine-rich domain-containing protein n=1 Tax=Catenovulum sediminis TaxID=1740262 RepID=A0ABV1RGJ8_9ALTE|nr:SulA-like leucine-rich domain-containing protein [Catenovulum sediminis]
MKTIISTDKYSKTHLLAVQNNSSEFEQRFWRSIAKLQESKRWLCIIAPSKMPSKSFLREMGVQLDKMLVIHQQKSSAYTTTKKALLAGKCSTVVAWLDSCSNAQHQEIKALATQAKSQIVLIKEEYKTTPIEKRAVRKLSA